MIYIPEKEKEIIEKAIYLHIPFMIGDTLNVSLQKERWY